MQSSQVERNITQPLIWQQPVHYAQKKVAEKMLIEGQFSEAEIQAARLGAVFTCTTLIGGPLDQLLNALFSKH